MLSPKSRKGCWYCAIGNMNIDSNSMAMKKNILLQYFEYLC